MALVTLVFIGLVIYWVIKERREAREAASAAEAPATGFPVPEPGRTMAATPAPEPAVRMAAIPETGAVVPAPPAAIPTPVAITVTSPEHTGPEHATGRPTTLSDTDRASLWDKPVLAGFSEEERTALLDSMRYRTYKAGEIVFKEHDDAADVCLLVSGEIGLLTSIAHSKGLLAGVGHGKSLLVGVIKPGRLFAWSGLIGPHKFTATAHTMTNSVVGFLSADDAHRLMEHDLHFGRQLMELVAQAMAEELADSEVQFSALAGSAGSR